jgi:ATP-dependent DNA helicase RecG
LTVRDLLLYFPRRHDDFSLMTPIAQAQPGERVSVRGRLEHVRAVRTRRRGMQLTEGVLADATGHVRVVWFNQPYLAKSLRIGDELILAGKVDIDPAGRLTLQNPEHERVSADPRHTARLVPVYPETAGLTSRWLRGKVQPLLPQARAFPEVLPEETRERHQLMGRAEAVQQRHFPTDAQALAAARRRLEFEEMLLLQMAALRTKAARAAEPGVRIPFDVDDARAFVAQLPFRLTDAQRVAAWEILKDLDRNQPMNRLLQGDVGAGKTVVAAMATHLAARRGVQSVLMAPTEILAQQHANVIDPLLKSFGTRVALLLGSTPARQKALLRERLARQEVDVLISTHAVLEEDVRLPGLGLVIIDEQHRFGVQQRLTLREKGGGRNPHFLSLTATPIPRSLWLTLYGDLDISVIEKLPPGRRPVTTRVVPPEERTREYAFVRSQIAAGRQAFVICPLISESDKLGVRAATDEVIRLREQVFPDLNDRIELLHGRLKAKQKEAVMAHMVAGEIAILVATSVVEVGVDIPNASVMLIEGAERFGLAQLHQFRGRVGRGAHQSYCLLFSDSDSPESLERLQAVVQYQSGFDLAEIDLKLRGHGDPLGERQHGGPELNLDARLIREARTEAERLLGEDPELRRWPALTAALERYRRLFSPE